MVKIKYTFEVLERKARKLLINVYERQFLFNFDKRQTKFESVIRTS